MSVVAIGTAPCTSPATSSIVGPSNIVPNQQNVTYTVTNNSGSSYNWTVPAGATIISGQGTNSIVVDFGANAGVVTVQESNAFGSATPVTKNVSMTSTSVLATIETNLSIYPNPTNQTSYITLNNSMNDKVEISVIDMQGRTLLKSNWNTSDDFLIGNDLQSGVYIIQLKVQDQIVTKRWVKL